VLQRELGQLEDTGKKIDKPSFPGASKDLADALAGAVHGCEEGWRRGEMVGGLFKIGIVEHPGELPEEVEQAMMVADMLRTDEERFGHFYKKGDDDDRTV
jgi:hypothetical protein